MKKIAFLFSLISLNIYSSAQQISCIATFGSINRPTPTFGFNATGYIPPNIPTAGYIGANFSQQWFTDSAIVLDPEILRFPGGTNANHWDWQTGWFLPAYQPASGGSLTIRADEFKPALQGCHAEGLYVLNLETSSAHYEMDGLRHAVSIGLTSKLVELGNEHNLNGGTAFPLQLMTPTNYSQLAKTYFDSVRAVFPAAKICAVGGNALSGAGIHWNDSILNYIPSIDAFAFHVYLTANNADLVFNVNRALAIPFGNASNSTTLLYRYNTAGFSALPASKEVWVTEFNLQENQIASTPVIAQTWTHLLYVTAENNFFLSQSNITMILNHSLASNSDYFEAISKFDKHITANGTAMKLLYDMSKGSSTCRNMSFSGSPSITYGSAVIPKLIGWKFDSVGIEKGFICNFSTDTFNLSLASIFSNPMHFDQFYADTNFVVNGLSSINKYSGNSTDNIVIYPFSVTQISPSASNGIEQPQAAGSNSLWIYPNPSNEAITLKTDHSFSNAEIIVYTISGQEALKARNISGQTFQIPTHNLSRGTYLVHIKNGEETVTTKFIID